MTEVLAIGCVPCCEDCAQLGQEGYTVQARKECKAYINQIKRIIEKELPELKVEFRITGFPHDFGTYYEVEALGDENLYDLEEHLPEDWDNLARIELGINIP